MRTSERCADLRPAPCPRCGEMADYRILEGEVVQVEIACPACGRFTMSKEQFDEAVADTFEPEERR
jgi:predicted RNA-binding Zn-ribbon protein involved in translation (DUF1610 family)